MTSKALTVEQLERWALSGAHWRVVEITGEHAVVDLCACTGECVERAVSVDRAMISYLSTTRSDLDAT